MRSWNRLGVFMLFAMATICVVGCSSNSTPQTPPPTPTYTIGGTISGITAAGLVLQDNGGDNFTVSANATSFTFATAITSGGAYSVSVFAEPTGFNCAVTSGSGTASANVTSVSIACIQAYSIGGSVFGLSGAGLSLEDNGGNKVTVSAGSPSYAFVFPGAIPSGGAPYSVTVSSDPAGQECTVANPAGTATANVTNANVSCSAVPSGSFTISGTIKGLKTSGVMLQDQAGINDDDLLPVSANGTFSFLDPIAVGGSYNVSVLTQPTGRFCAVSNGTGTPTADVTNVSVVCLGEWTWMGGSKSGGGYGGQPGVYGTLGTPAAANVPGGRERGVTWIDKSGKAWLFGGQGQDSTGSSFGVLNDLWQFDPTLGTTGEWTWMGGSNVAPPSTSSGTSGEPGTYGTLGIAVPSNDPGARTDAASWVDASGVLWMFGGEGIDAYGLTGYLNDMWKFDPTQGTAGEWTWMGGNNTVGVPFGGQTGVYGTPGTPASTNIPGGRYGSITWKDASGNFWLFGGSGVDISGAQGYLNDMWKFTPSTGQWTWMGGDPLTTGSQGQSGVYGTQGTPFPSNIPGGREDGVAWTDASGNLWLFGGIGADANGNFAYENDLWKYDPTLYATGGWAWMGGSSTAPTTSEGQPGIYGAQGTAASANTPGGRFGALTWTDASGNVWLSGGDGYDSADTSGYLNDLWEYTPGATGSVGQWAWMGGSSTVGISQGQPGSYGILGVTGTGTPGGRFGSVGWIDASGSLWLFGGNGYDSTGAEGYLNDLWKYQP